MPTPFLKIQITFSLFCFSALSHLSVKLLAVPDCCNQFFKYLRMKFSTPGQSETFNFLKPLTRYSPVSRWAWPMTAKMHRSYFLQGLIQKVLHISELSTSAFFYCSAADQLLGSHHGTNINISWDAWYLLLVASQFEIVYFVSTLFFFFISLYLSFVTWPDFCLLTLSSYIWVWYRALGFLKLVS